MTPEELRQWTAATEQQLADHAGKIEDLEDQLQALRRDYAKFKATWSRTPATEPDNCPECGRIMRGGKCMCGYARDGT